MEDKCEKCGREHSDRGIVQSDAADKCWKTGSYLCMATQISNLTAERDRLRGLLERAYPLLSDGLISLREDIRRELGMAE
jgi:hypothetical protein